MSDEFCRAHMDNRQERVFFPEKEFCAGEGVSSAFCVGEVYFWKFFDEMV